MSRGPGEGTISYRKKEGRWEARYTVYVNGVPKRKVLYAREYDEARKKLARKGHQGPR